MAEMIGQTPVEWTVLFFLFGFIGWCWEVAYCWIVCRKIVNRGFLTGPILPIYGIGAVGILLLCQPINTHLLAVALIGGGAATLLELSTGMLMEALFHVRLWDYSGETGNVQGYICPRAAALWAVLSVAMVKAGKPLLLRITQRLPQPMTAASMGLLAFFCLADAINAVRNAWELRRVLEDAEQGGLSELQEGRLRRIRRLLRGNPRAISLRHSKAMQRVRENHVIEKA